MLRAVGRALALFVSLHLAGSDGPDPPRLKICVARSHSVCLREAMMRYFIGRHRSTYSSQLIANLIANIGASTSELAFPSTLALIRRKLCSGQSRRPPDYVRSSRCVCGHGGFPWPHEWMWHPCRRAAITACSHVTSPQRLFLISWLAMAHARLSFGS